MTTCDCEACFKKSFKNNNKNDILWHNLFVKQVGGTSNINLEKPGENGSVTINNTQYYLKYIIAENLGEGLFGVVQKYALHSKKTSKEKKKMNTIVPIFYLAIKFASKIFKKDNKVHDDQELCALKKLKKHKCSIMNARSTSNEYKKCNYYITLMPLMDGTLINLKPYFLRDNAKDIITQIHTQVKCLYNSLENNKLYYMDLKHENVMYMKNVDNTKEQYKYYLGDLGSLCTNVFSITTYFLNDDFRHYSKKTKTYVDKYLAREIGYFYITLLGTGPVYDRFDKEKKKNIYR